MLMSRAPVSALAGGEPSKARGWYSGVAEFAARRIVWLIAAVDVLLLTLCVHFAVWGRLGWLSTATLSDLVPFTTFPGASLATVLISFVCLYIFELYSPKDMRRISNVVARLCLAFATTLVAISLLSFWLPSWLLFRSIQLYFAAIAFPVLCFWRLIAIHAAENWVAPTRVVLLGADRQLRVLEEAFAQHPWSKLDVVARIVEGGTSMPSPAEGRAAAEPSATATAELLDIAVANRASAVVAAFSGTAREETLLQLLRCKGIGLQVIDGATLYKAITGRVPIRLADMNWMAFGPNFDLSGHTRTRLVQRATDLLIASLGLALALPLMLLTALAIVLVDGGSPLFYQERVGENGRCYSLIKFRTMRRDAEKDGPQWANKGDSRLIPLGGLLRATRLDELPQLWNVLRGEMSIIGPRPERPYFVERLNKSIPFYALRLSVKPGLTGWAQVNYGYGATEEDAAVKLEYDLYYIQEISLYLNLLILLRTVSTVLFRRGT